MAPRLLYTAERGFISKVTNPHVPFPDPGTENSPQLSPSISLIAHCNSFLIWHDICPSIKEVLFTKFISNNSTVETTLLLKVRIKQTCFSLRMSSAINASSFHDLAITKVTLSDTWKFCKCKLFILLSYNSDAILISINVKYNYHILYLLFRAS